MTAKERSGGVARRGSGRRGHAPRRAALWTAALAALTAGGCTDSRDGCFRDLQADACRSVCRGGDSQACGALQYIEARAGNAAAQKTLCERGDMFMCEALADREPDVAAKRKILEDACAQGENGAPACAHLADILIDPAEKRSLLERTCAMRRGLLACGRLADIEPDPATRAKRLASTCVAGLEDRCARLAELDPSPSSRRALLLEACERMGPACAIHPIEWAMRAARVPPEPADAGGSK